MANPNPHAARLARRRKRKPGDLLAAQRILWTALCEAEAVLLEADEAELTLKACHCISQCVGQFARLVEVAEYEGRLALVEEELRKGRVRL